MENNTNPLASLCDYLCEWTISQYEDSLNTEMPISSEVRDRVVSVVGIAVPVGMYTLCLFFFIFMICCIGTIFRRKGAK